MATKRDKLFSEQIRRAVETCGKTRYRIWQETGVSQSLLSEFMHGTTGLSLDTLDKLAKCIGMKVVLSKPAKRKERR